MALEEQVESYKALPLTKRLMIGALVGLLPVGYLYYEDSEAIGVEKVAAQDKLNKARSSLKTAQAQKNKIPEMEKKISETKDEIFNAQQVLPDEFIVDEILRDTATIAKDLDVEMNSFKPNTKERRSGKAYAELEIGLMLRGSFRNITSFYDRILHLTNLVHIKNVNYRVLPPKLNIRSQRETVNGLSIFERAERIVQVESRANMVVYRSTN